MANSSSNRLVVAVVVAACAVGAFLVLRGSDTLTGDADELARLSGGELATLVRGRGPELNCAISLLVPYAKKDDAEYARKALVHALAAGPNVPIYEPAAKALEEVGEPAIATLRASLFHESLWIVRYSVIMLGRMADGDDEETIRLLKSLRGRYGDTAGSNHIGPAIDQSIKNILGRSG